MSLTNEERVAIIEYRIEKANSTLDEAKKVFDFAMYNLAANRLYYCVYYAATALLLKNELPSHTHIGAMTLFYQYFVKTNILSSQEGGLFRQLYGMRHEGDYEDFVDYSKEDIEPYIGLAEVFVNKIKDLLGA